MMTEAQVLGIVLAAGAGTRMGVPKALMHDCDGTSWLRRSVEVLRRGGCGSVLVVLGAESDSAAALLSGVPVEIEVCPTWHKGLSATLQTGLNSAMSGPGSIALLHLVDLPDISSEVVSRVLESAGTSTTALARACYKDQPGHPVAVGRGHWGKIVASAKGDDGARGYLAQHEVLKVECGDLATGRDRDYRDGVRGMSGYA